MAISYSEKLKDPRWVQKRNLILARDSNTCQMCKYPDDQLEVHHIHYTGEPWDAKNEDLITVCAYCHEAIEEDKKYGNNRSAEEITNWKNRTGGGFFTLKEIINSEEFKSQFNAHYHGRK